MIARLGDWLSRAASRFVPDPFVLAIALTGVVLVAGAARLARQGAASIGWILLEGWTSGFAAPSGLAFALQMCLVLVTGHALALSPPVQRVVEALARRVRRPATAAAVVCAVACMTSIIHWGLGAIVGAFLAREIGKRLCVPRDPFESNEANGTLHYPLLGAAAYAGFAVWHGGFSGSAPLKVAEEGHFAAAHIEGGVLPVSATLLSPLNLAVTGTLCLLLPALYWAMTPRGAATPNPAGAPPASGAYSWSSVAKGQADSQGGTDERRTLADQPALGLLLGIAGLTVVVAGWWAGRIALDLNLVNFVFLFVGLAFQGRLGRYVDAITEGTRGAGAIILQFPFYFGILGVMKASGMIAAISGAMVSVATKTTFPVVAFLSAGVVNFLVPSGGGQWAVQGDILLGAGRALGVDAATTVMAFAYGDAWTNLLQPFWALPLLGIMGLRAQDIIGYTAVACLVVGAVVPLLLLALG